MDVHTGLREQVSLLTPRQRRMLGVLAENANSDDVGREFALRPREVEQEMTAIHDRLPLKPTEDYRQRIIDLAEVARKRGILEGHEDSPPDVPGKPAPVPEPGGKKRPKAKAKPKPRPKRVPKPSAVDRPRARPAAKKHAKPRLKRSVPQAPPRYQAHDLVVIRGLTYKGLQIVVRPHREAEVFALLRAIARDE